MADVSTKLISDETVVKIYDESGKPKDIAKKYNVSVATVRRIKNLSYKKYRDIIFKHKNDVIEKIKSNKENVEHDKTEVTTENKNSKEEELIIKIRNMTKDVIIIDISNILIKYLTPQTVKYAIDNYILSEKNETLIQDIINKIKTGNIDFYVKTLTTLTIGILNTIYSQEVLDKLFPEK